MGRLTIAIDWTSQGSKALRKKCFDDTDDPQSLGKPKKKDEGESALTLYKCLDKYREREILGENDKWYCNKCNEHVCASKQLTLWKTPEILVIQLKRFMYEQGRWAVHRDRISNVVDC